MMALKTPRGCRRHRCFQGGANDGHTVVLEFLSQIERRLTTKLNDHTVGLFQIADIENIFQGHGLEVETIGDVVVRGNGLGVGVHHDGLKTSFLQGPWRREHSSNRTRYPDRCDWGHHR